jgi:hypothetical protein
MLVLIYQSLVIGAKSGATFSIEIYCNHVKRY